MALTSSSSPWSWSEPAANSCACWSSEANQRCSPSSFPAVLFDNHQVLLWRNRCHAFDHPSAPGSVGAPPPRMFQSHATADEPQLRSSLTLLRRLGVEILVCGDSIQTVHAGETILAARRAYDRFVLVMSPASRQSSCCTLEARAAVACGKPIRLLSLDVEPPTSFVIHLQMIDVPRTIRSRPRQTVEDALGGALIAGENHIAEP